MDKLRSGKKRLLLMTLALSTAFGFGTQAFGAQESSSEGNSKANIHERYAEYSRMGKEIREAKTPREFSKALKDFMKYEYSLMPSDKKNRLEALGFAISYTGDIENINVFHHAMKKEEEKAGFIEELDELFRGLNSDVTGRFSRFLNTTRLTRKKHDDILSEKMPQMDNVLREYEHPTDGLELRCPFEEKDNKNRLKLLRSLKEDDEKDSTDEDIYCASNNGSELLCPLEEDDEKDSTDEDIYCASNNGSELLCPLKEDDEKDSTAEDRYGVHPIDGLIKCCGCLFGCCSPTRSS